MVRGSARDIQVYNPSPNSLDVRWDPAPGPVQQYRIVYSPVDGTRPSDSVSNVVSSTQQMTFVGPTVPPAMAAGPEQ